MTQRAVTGHSSPLRACGLEEESAAAGEETPSGGATEMAGPDTPGQSGDDSEEVPVREHARPRQGDATIVCDGAGGYRPDLRGWASAPCGIVDCVRGHEQSHANDWKGRWPDGCKGKKDGADIPLGGPGYAAFLKQSECRAYTFELNCVTPLAAAGKGDCKKKLDDHKLDTENQKTSFC
ncbi:MAG: hypothetical protein NVSMB32_13730 [Actinomycetota bacterium]